MQTDLQNDNRTLRWVKFLTGKYCICFGESAEYVKVETLCGKQGRGSINDEVELYHFNKTDDCPECAALAKLIINL